MKNTLLKPAKKRHGHEQLSAIAMATFSPTAALAAEHHGGHGGGFSGGHSYSSRSPQEGRVTTERMATAGPSAAAEGIMADAVTTARATMAEASV